MSIATSPRWLVTGATGLLGANAVIELSKSHDVFGVARRIGRVEGLSSLSLDLSSASARDGLVEKSGAHVVLHTAAVSSIEACEQDPDLALELNVRAARDLAKQADAAGARFLHISTDAVFDGTRGSYLETDDVSPTTAYGRTKADAEAAVLAANPRALVARVNFYGWSPSGTRSIAEFFYNRLSRGKLAPGFTDVTVSTMYVRTLIDQLIALEHSGANGIVHVVNDEPTTKFDLARRIARVFGFDEGLVTPGVSTEHLSIGRGSDLTLVTDRLHAMIDTPQTTQSSDAKRLVDDSVSDLRSIIATFSPEEHVHERQDR